jgi:seryl-tRNA synthetase
MTTAMEQRIEAITPAIYHQTGVLGVYIRTQLFERVIEGLNQLITAHREPGTEVLRFPPVMSLNTLEKSGYVKNFPQLLGGVCCMPAGKPGDPHAEATPGQDHVWADNAEVSDLVLTPAACYPVYPMAAKRGPVPKDGLKFDVASDCFRREPSVKLDRLQTFRMREYVCIGSGEQVLAFRERWLATGQEMATRLGLTFHMDKASDPFFGRMAQLMAMSQVVGSLKFELLVPIYSPQEPTACMSFNYHRDHFGQTWDLNNADGEHAHTGCAAFGLDRLGLALFATHGADLARWPAGVREALGLTHDSKA